ncbi:MAG: ferredoxin-thioredoxin reductase catalytic domain-containing protein [Syntrophorhabdus sp.]
MSSNPDATLDEIQGTLERLKKEAEAYGYHLNADDVFTAELIRGLIINQKRYGYASCPCRLSEGDKWKDLDIICPCDYRDPDLGEYGACYCALYVSEAVLKGEKQLGPVPERRNAPDERKGSGPSHPPSGSTTVSYPVWRCKVCGYLCAREQPPDVCPICKADKERFERFL